MTRRLVHTAQFKRDYRKRILSPKAEAALADVLGRVRRDRDFPGALRITRPTSMRMLWVGRLIPKPPRT
jgi:hypothetical protein